MIEAMRKWYERQQHHPSFLAPLVNPFHIARSGLAGAMRRLGGGLGGRVLDVGCGQKPYQGLVSHTEYVGLEYDTPENRRNKKADEYYDGTAFPFPDGSFDSVLCNQVLEHVFEPGPFLEEIYRVLAPGGKLLLTIPFVWDEHEQPFDYARYSSFGLRHLLEGHGFEVLRQEKIAADLRVVFQLAICYIHKRFFTGRARYDVFLCALLCAPLTVAGIVLGSLLPRNEDLYLDQVVLAVKRA